ncbi:efflux RND transporter periplasmic adaptor subunit [Pseudomonas alliivorans]|uniref:Efflux RND transporter periplasmic adaptor subunit n=1 Tax=Pseudomonas cannabina pv. alisalensis TaxID=757414 RepID=A0ABS1X7T9_PSEC1|nr:efflux RND transporter periplasmic adaptor subunit [Pseudomonas cannabina]MEE4964497.1 efflux RND transporter periplasmic adaptor subunit [Pseudomonas alliivorans]MBM0137557.1 efflux RND transporter periplasmic adaptor subunit [Pseudomonas cannabina pv. alisalensis]MEE4974580.1 efflux RND transporter periplasmic adaptor subunit [Pseudomonas alliivorans]MEE4979729.1 efflux RND transporter periplasmic adaptor subunit [Pseudomonas alliivorans]MEE4984818.1 efflux RND transporter periplasmic ada
MKGSYAIGALTAACLLGVGGLLGFWLGTTSDSTSVQPDTTSTQARKALYWYDPMKPDQHFDKPGRSPFMDMDLVPKYADEQASTSLAIAAGTVQSLGVRTVRVQRGALPSSIDAAGTLEYSQRELATIQARADAYVEKIYDRAPGDVLPAGAPLVDLLIPQWSAAQLEYLAVKHTGDAQLTGAAKERLRLLGMPGPTIAAVDRTGRAAAVQTIVMPIAGEVQSLEARAGMAISKGQDLARINGLSKVWLDIAVPEALASRVTVGNPISASFVAWPGQAVQGKIISVLPSADSATRTVTVRAELPNANAKLRPGMYAQVRLQGDEQTSVLLVPSEAIIRSGKRCFVMVALPEGRYRPQLVVLGKEAGGQAEIVEGLAEGDEVVSSGQFLLDSEASLQGLLAREGSSQGAKWHSSSGEIVDLDSETVTLAHGPFQSLGMPGMTMTFPLARPDVAAGIKVGDQVVIQISKGDAGLVVEQLSRQEPRQ